MFETVIRVLGGLLAAYGTSPAKKIWEALHVLTIPELCKSAPATVDSSYKRSCE